MRNQLKIVIKVPDDLLRRALYIAQAEGRTPNNQMLLLMRNNIQYYERTHGRISDAKLRDIDLSAYSDDNNNNENNANGGENSDG